MIGSGGVFVSSKEEWPGSIDFGVSGVVVSIAQGVGSIDSVYLASQFLKLRVSDRSIECQLLWRQDRSICQTNPVVIEIHGRTNHHRPR